MLGISSQSPAIPRPMSAEYVQRDKMMREGRAWVRSRRSVIAFIGNGPLRALYNVVHHFADASRMKSLCSIWVIAGLGAGCHHGAAGAVDLGAIPDASFLPDGAMMCGQQLDSCTSTTQCCEGLICDTTAGRNFCDACQNARCANDLDCCPYPGGWACDVDVGRCRAGLCLETGAVCSHSSECCYGGSCDQGRCAPWGVSFCKSPGTSGCVAGACCDPDSAGCTSNGRCCIDPVKQAQHSPIEIRCYAQDDCCSGTCELSTGRCQ